MTERRVVLASNNAGKLREFAAILAPAGLHMVAQGELGVSEAEEPHDTFLENALAKARHASLATGLPALADDSGLCVEALGGAPGVYSARYAQLAGQGSGDEANNRYLLKTLASGSVSANRRASYIAVLVYVRSADDPRPIVAEGEWSGRILEAPQGENGFGYDPLFKPDDQACSAASLAPELKNAVSHRARALKILLDRLRISGT